MSEPIDIAGLRELLAAGTADSPAPWRHLERKQCYEILDEDSNDVAATPHDEPAANLIVAAVNSLPVLLDEIERLRARVEELETNA